MHRLHCEFGALINRNSTNLPSKISLGLLSSIFIILETPVWALAILLSPVALAVGGKFKNSLANVICLGHIRAFLSAALAKPGADENGGDNLSNIPRGKINVDRLKIGYRLNNPCAFWDEKFEKLLEDTEIFFPEKIESMYCAAQLALATRCNNLDQNAVKTFERRLWKGLGEIVKLAKAAKTGSVDENILTMVYVDVFNYAARWSFSNALSLPASPLLDARVFGIWADDEKQDLSEVNIDDIHQCIEPLSKLVDSRLLHKVDTVSIKNFFTKVAGVWDCVKIVGMGFYNTVFELQTSPLGPVCVKEIQSNAEESKKFLSPVLCKFFECATAMNPNLFGRTAFTSEIGELFARHRDGFLPTHITQKCDFQTVDKKVEYIAMGKVDGEVVGNLIGTGFFKDGSWITEEAVESLIDCQFLEMLTGNLDGHLGNCAFGHDKRFRIFDAGFAFPPFHAVGKRTDIAQQAARQLLRDGIWFEGSEVERNQKRIRKHFPDIHLSVDPNKINYIKCDVLITVYYYGRRKNILQQILTQVNCLLSKIEVKGSSEELNAWLCNIIYDEAMMALHTYNETFPWLTAKLKLAYTKILDDFEGICESRMKAYNFTQWEIDATKERAALLRGKLNSTVQYGGNYKDYVSFLRGQLRINQDVWRQSMLGSLLVQSMAP
ncbi:MAG: hypothetical protein LBI69_03095 [Puniceicoccales bacterium]|jgi:hypothetical protein|nr:hypothetical protein [Puniceicoccales bacterium]